MAVECSLLATTFFRWTNGEILTFLKYGYKMFSKLCENSSNASSTMENMIPSIANWRTYHTEAFKPGQTSMILNEGTRWCHLCSKQWNKWLLSRLRTADVWTCKFVCYAVSEQLAAMKQDKSVCRSESISTWISGWIQNIYNGLKYLGL